MKCFLYIFPLLIFFNVISVRGPLPSPNISSIGHRYSADHLHHHASPMHGTRSPHIQSPNMTPYNMPPGGVIEQPQVMIGGGPHSAGPMSSVSVDWGAQVCSCVHSLNTFLYE